MTYPLVKGDPAGEPPAFSVRTGRQWLGDCDDLCLPSVPRIAGNVEVLQAAYERMKQCEPE
jgi:hypothetical protein